MDNLHMHVQEHHVHCEIHGMGLHGMDQAYDKVLVDGMLEQGGDMEQVHGRLGLGDDMEQVHGKLGLVDGMVQAHDRILEECRVLVHGMLVLEHDMVLAHDVQEHMGVVHDMLELEHGKVLVHGMQVKVVHREEVHGSLELVDDMGQVHMVGLDCMVGVGMAHMERLERSV